MEPRGSAVTDGPVISQKLQQQAKGPRMCENPSMSARIASKSSGVGPLRIRSLVAAAMAASLAAGISTPGVARQSTQQRAASQRLVPNPITEGVEGWSTAEGTDGRTWFVDADGRSLTFRGFGAKTADPESHFSEDLLKAGADRGFNLIRLSFFWDELEPAQGVWNEEYLDEMEVVLDRAEQYGYRVIVAMHQDVFGPAFGSRGIPEWATRTGGAAFEPQESWLLDYMQPAVQNAFEALYEDEDLRQAQIDMWVKVVNRLKGHPSLFGYDLFNEPFGKIREGEDLFGAAARVEREQLTPMYQRLTDAIVPLDAASWIFIEPPNLNSLGIPTSLGRVNGPRVALYPHMYNSAIESATYHPGGKFEYDHAFFDSWKKAVMPYPLREKIPMLVGEWGVAKPEFDGMAEFLVSSGRTLDEATSSGWTMYSACFGGGYCTFDAEGNDRTGIKEMFQPYGRAIAGAVTSTLWDNDANVLRLRYRDSAAEGPTEIYVPEALRYAGGFEIRVSGVKEPVDFDWNTETEVASVSVEDNGSDHAICVVPTGWQGECLAVDPAEKPVPQNPSTPPAAAVPVQGNADYTG